MSEADTERVAARIQAALNQKNADGSFRWSKEEVRDFVVACTLELGLGIPPPLEKTFLDFLGGIEVPADAPPEVTAEAIRGYFVEHPLPKDLLRELNELARSELTGDRDDWDGHLRLARAAARLQTTGTEEVVRAPATSDNKRTPKPPRRGLS